MWPAFKVNLTKYILFTFIYIFCWPVEVRVVYLAWSHTCSNFRAFRRQVSSFAFLLSPAVNKCLVFPLRPAVSMQCCHSAASGFLPPASHYRDTTNFIFSPRTTTSEVLLRLNGYMRKTIFQSRGGVVVFFRIYWFQLLMLGHFISDNRRLPKYAHFAGNEGKWESYDLQRAAVSILAC